MGVLPSCRETQSSSPVSVDPSRAADAAESWTQGCGSVAAGCVDNPGLSDCAIVRRRRRSHPSLASLLSLPSRSLGGFESTRNHGCGRGTSPSDLPFPLILMLGPPREAPALPAFLRAVREMLQTSFRADKGKARRQGEASCSRACMHAYTADLLRGFLQ